MIQTSGVVGTAEPCPAPIPPRTNNGGQYAVVWLREFKQTNPCTDCGLFYPWYVMEADHIDGLTTRERNQKPHQKNASATRNGYCAGGTATAARLRADLEEQRAEIVCANCHKARTRRRYDEKKEAA